MSSMLERERSFTPVTSSIVDRNTLARGSQEKVVTNIVRKNNEEGPALIVVTPTCTSSILQEDLQNFVVRASVETNSDVLLADVHHYRVNELQAADKTLAQIVKFYLPKSSPEKVLRLDKTDSPSVNIIGALNLSLHNKHDLLELRKLLGDLGLKINLIIPEGASVRELANLPRAWFNVVMSREIGLSTAEYLKAHYNLPYTSTFPIGILGISEFIREIQSILDKLDYGVNFEGYIVNQTKFISQSAWFSRSIDCQNLTGKRAVVFGDATHSAYITKMLSQEMGIHVSWAGTYSKSDLPWFKCQVDGFCDRVIVTEDHRFVRDLIKKTNPAAIFGSQMERHIGKKLGIPCGVISSPVHVQNFPLGYKPFLGYEGANQISDLIYNSFTLGMEDHLLELFGGHEETDIFPSGTEDVLSFEWSEQAKNELKKIPKFVRNNVVSNIEEFAKERNLRVITKDVMDEARHSLFL